MIVASRSEARSLEKNLAGLAALDDADAVGAGRCFFARRDGEQEFVVFAAAEGSFERSAGVDGDLLERGADVGCAAQAREVERETVAQIHTGRRETAQTFEIGRAHV